MVAGVVVTELPPVSNQASAEVRLGHGSRRSPPLRCPRQLEPLDVWPSAWCWRSGGAARSTSAPAEGRRARIRRLKRVEGVGDLPERLRELVLSVETQLGAYLLPGLGGLSIALGAGRQHRLGLLRGEQRLGRNLGHSAHHTSVGLRQHRGSLPSP